MTEGEKTSAPLVVASATSRGARFVAPSNVVEMRLQVFSSTGEKVFDSEFRRGSVLDWDASGKKQPGKHVLDDSYLCVVTVRDLSGSLRQRLGLAKVQAGNVTLTAAVRSELLGPQAQAWAASKDAKSLASLTEDSNEDALKIVSDQKAKSMTLTAHDSRDSQVTATTGDLTLRTGDVFTGEDTEQVRITKDGKVGIGTDQPKATLDVVGAVRASEGFRFPDGTTLTAGNGKLSVSNSEGVTMPAPNLAGTGTQNQVAKWIDNVGTLGDSAITELNGNVGIGLTNPAARLHIFGSTETVRQTLSLTNSFIQFGFYEGAVKKGAFGYQGSTSAGFIGGPGAMVFGTLTGSPVAFFTSGTERLRLDTNGNVGIGTTTPAARLDVQGSIKLTGVGNSITFPDGTTQTTAATVGVTGTGTTNTVPVWSSATALGNSVITQSSGSIGIGTPTPAAKLDVAGNVRVSGSVSGASANIAGSLTVADNLLFVWPEENQVIVEGVLNVDDQITTSTHYSIAFDRVLSIAGTENVFVGVGAGAANTASGSQNTFVGFSAGLLNTTGDRNSFFGASAGAAQTTLGFDNSFFGNGAGAANTASSNSFFGSKAGTANTSGSFNAFFGEDAGAANVTGTSNSFFGTGAGAANTASLNAFFGRNAGAANTEGVSNAFFGAFAGDSNTTGDFNAFFGVSAGAANIDSDFNSFFGASAGTLSTGGSNSFFGHNAGELNTSGSFNAFFGQNAGSENTMGSSNTFFGQNAGLSNTTEANNTFIGANSNGAAGITNAIAIGANATVAQSNSLVLGSGVKVGVGTSAPKEKLHVLGGNILIEDSAGGIILKSPNGLTCAKLTIDNAGVLVTTVITCP